MTALDLARLFRGRQHLVGYWVLLDDPVATERLGRLGYDYVVIDEQHGMLGYEGIRNGLLAIDAGGRSAAFVRVAANDPVPIGRALDAGATGVIVPLVDTAADAAAAVRSARYPPAGRRSFGPIRAELRVDPTPAVADETVLVIAMIETADGLANVAEICATPGIDGVYVGPSDLHLGLGGATPDDTSVDDAFEEALRTVTSAAEAAGVAAGIHTPSGTEVARRLGQGFTFSTAASDLTHLEDAARRHLADARPSS